MCIYEFTVDTVRSDALPEREGFWCRYEKKLRPYDAMDAGQ